MFPGVYIGNFFLPSYGVCALIGIFTTFSFAVRRYYKITHDAPSMIFVILWAAVGAFLGMHLLFGFTNISSWGLMFKTDNFSDFCQKFSEIFGGSVYYGGLIGGIAAGAISAHARHMRFDIVGDCTAPAIPMFHCIARIGCFFAGCCYGVKWEGGVTFENSIVGSANGVPRVPVQLIEATFNLLTSAILLFLFYKTTRLKGRLLPLYLIIYSLGRFGLEFLRGDEYRGFVFGLSTSQFISIIIFIIGIVTIVFYNHKHLFHKSF